MVFKRNKKYYCLLKEVKKNAWLSKEPLFICGNKGLFPVFNVNAKYGKFPKNHQEFILKEIKSESESRKVLKEWNI